MVFQFTRKILGGLWAFLKGIWGTDADYEEEDEEISPENASTFGDFNSFLKKKKDPTRYVAN